MKVKIEFEYHLQSSHNTGNTMGLSNNYDNSMIDNFGTSGDFTHRDRLIRTVHYRGGTICDQSSVSSEFDAKERILTILRNFGHISRDIFDNNDQEQLFDFGNYQKPNPSNSFKFSFCETKLVMTPKYCLSMNIISLWMQ